MAEVLNLNYNNVHEAAIDDILHFDGCYAELQSSRTFPEGIKCMDMSLYHIIDYYKDVRLIKRGMK